MEFTADISKYIDAGVELAKKHPMGSTLVIVLVLFFIVIPMIGSNWIDFLKKLKDIGGQKGNFDMADLSKEQTRVMQNLALMSDNRTLPFAVRDWIGCKERTLKSLVKSGWLTRTERGYKVPAAVREVVLMNEVPVEAVEQFLRFAAYRDYEYFREGESEHEVQCKLEIIDAVLKHVEGRLEENWDTCSLYHELGFLYHERGKMAQSEECNRKSLVICLKVKGEDDTDTAVNYNNLGVDYEHQEKYDEAVELFLKAWKIWKRKDHWYTKTAIDNLRACFPYIDHGDQDFDTWLSQQ